MRSKWLFGAPGECNSPSILKSEYRFLLHLRQLPLFRVSTTMNIYKYKCIFSFVHKPKKICAHCLSFVLTLHFHCCIFVVFCTSKLQLLRPLSTEDDLLDSLCTWYFCIYHEGKTLCNRFQSSSWIVMNNFAIKFCWSNVHLKKTLLVF